MFSNCKMFIGFGYCQQRGVTVVFLFFNGHMAIVLAKFNLARSIYLRLSGEISIGGLRSFMLTRMFFVRDVLCRVQCNIISKKDYNL